MTRGHAIETLSFEVAFATEAQARDQHMRVGDFAAGRGVSVIEEVLDEFAGDGETVRLDRLEVDLGETPPDWSDAEAEQRLREALRRALRAAIGASRADGAARPAAAAGDAAELEMVWGHLRHGLLPWSLATVDADHFEALVVRVMVRQGAALAERLRAAPALERARLIARLARQWPRGALEALAQRLGAAPEALADLPPPQTAPELWAERLRRQAGGADAEAPLAGPGGEIRLDEGGWPRLINGAPAEVRARLRALGVRPEARVRLARLLTDARQRQLLSLWASDADAGFLQALLAAPRAWRLGGSVSEPAVAQALREALLEHLLTDAADTLDVATAVEALVAARARAEGLAPVRVAQALAAVWPADEAHASTRARLRAALAARLPDAAALATQAETTEGPPAPRGWRFDLAPPDEAGEPAAAPEAVWRRRARFEPAGLAEQLRRLGRTAAARRRLARDLTPARLAEVLGLWLEPKDATFIAAVVATPESWRLAEPHTAADLARLLRQWVLDELLLAPPGPPRDAADLLLALLRRRAAHDDLAPHAVARALAAAWPPAGSAGEVGERLREILAQAAPALAGPEPASPGVRAATDGPTASGGVPTAGGSPVRPSAASIGGDRDAPAQPASERTPAQASDPEIAAARAALAAAFAADDLAAVAAPLRTLLAADRTWLAELLRPMAADRRRRAGLAAALPPPLLFELVQPWLSEPALRLLLVTAPAAAESREAREAFWAEVLGLLWAPGAATGPPAPEAATAGPAAPISASALARRILRRGALADRPARLRALQAAGAYVRDEVPLDTASSAGPLAAWRGRLADRPSAASVRAISALLAPASLGLRALADFTEPERRDLLQRLRPVDAPAALGAASLLADAARAAALAEPPEGWAAFGWRAVLRELFEEGRAFDAPGFARRWFEAWSAGAPAEAAETARRRLAVALEALPLSGALGPPRPDGARPAGPTPAADAPRAPGAAATAPPATPPSAHAGAPAEPPPHEAPPPASPDTGPPPPGAAPTAASATRPGPALDPSAGARGTAPPPPGPDDVSAQAPATVPHDTPTSWPPPLPTPEDEAAAAPLQAATDTPAAPPAGAQPSAGVAPAPSTAAPGPAALAAALRSADSADPPTDAVTEPTPDGVLYIDNAGLVLAGPFIPMLFNRLDLTRGGKFIDERRRERAVHILQFLVDGQEQPAPEHRLTLNKLVCGLDFPIPVGRDFRIEDAERALIESLLRTIIERWSTLGRTSIAGLRETFLMRGGAITPQEEAWRLVVEPGPFDMLLDRIPWGYGLLKLPWMAQVLHVDWR